MIDKHRLQRLLFAASASRLGIFAEHFVPVLAYGDNSSLKPLGRLYAVCRRCRNGRNLKPLTCGGLASPMQVARLQCLFRTSLLLLYAGVPVRR